jgi:polyisoprenoid-binding protein YceI
LEETIVADLTIKWVTLPVTLNRSEGDDGLGATFSIDSTQWGVQEGWSLVDQAKNALVSDDIDFVVTLVLQ